MWNIDQVTIQKAIENSRNMYNRDSSLWELLREYTNRQVLIDSDEWREIQKIADWILNIDELQRTYNILERGLKKSLRQLKRWIKLDESLWNIQDVIWGRLELLRTEWNIEIWSPRHKAYLALEESQEILSGLSWEDVLKYQMFIWASRLRLIWPDNLLAPPLQEGAVVKEKNTFQSISGWILGITQADGVSWYLPDTNLESIAYAITNPVPGYTYEPFSIQPWNNLDGEVDIDENALSLINESLKLARVDIAEYDNQETIRPLLKNISIATSEYFIIEAFIASMWSWPVSHHVWAQEVSGLKSTWWGSPFDRLDDMFSIDTFNKEWQIWERLLDLQSDTRDVHDETLIAEIAKVGRNIKFSSSEVIEKERLENIFYEMRDGVDGSSLNPMSRDNFVKSLSPIFQASIQTVGNDLNAQLDELIWLSPEEYAEGWDPHIRLWKWINKDGEIIWAINYGPYSNPKEKAIGIVSLLALLSAAQKDGTTMLSILWDNWIIDVWVAMIPGDWDDFTIIHLWVMERFYANLFGGINRMRASRLNIGTLLWKTARFVIPWSRSENESQSNERIERSLNDRREEVKKLRTIIEDLWLKNTDWIDSELKDLLDENPDWLFNHTTLFNRKLFYSDLFGIINGKGRGVILTWWVTGRRAFAHYRLMEMLNVHVQSSLKIWEETDRMAPGTWEFEHRTILWRNIPWTGPVSVDPAYGVSGVYQNRVLWRRVDGTWTPLPYGDIREVYRFQQKGVWRESPLTFHHKAISSEEKIKSIIERHEMVSELFWDLKNFEKYRPDVVDDSKLEEFEKEIDEMRKRFLQWQQPELDGGDIKRWTDWKIIYEDLDMSNKTNRPQSDSIEDFKKFVKERMKANNPKFTLKYGRMLKADAISDADRTAENGNSPLTHLKKAEEYAKSLPSWATKDVMLQQLIWLREKLEKEVTASVTPETPEWTSPTQHSRYADHMTTTEFYTRLEMIVDGNTGYDQALTITDEAQFTTARTNVQSALSWGTWYTGPLTKVISPATTAEQNRIRFDWFDGEAVNEKSNARQLVDNLILHERIEGNVGNIAKLEGLINNPEQIRSIPGLVTLDNFKRHLAGEVWLTEAQVENIRTMANADLSKKWNKARFDWFNEDGVTPNSDSTSRDLVDRAILQAKINENPGRARELETLKSNPARIAALDVTRTVDFEWKLAAAPYSVSDIAILRDTPLADLQKEWSDKRFDWFTEWDSPVVNENSNAKRLIEKLKLHAKIAGDRALWEAIIEFEVGIKNWDFANITEFETKLWKDIWLDAVEVAEVKKTLKAKLEEQVFDVNKLDTPTSVEAQTMKKARLWAIIQGNPEVTIGTGKNKKTMSLLDAIDKASEEIGDIWSMKEFHRILKKYKVNLKAIWKWVSTDSLLAKVEENTIQVWDNKTYIIDLKSHERNTIEETMRNEENLDRQKIADKTIEVWRSKAVIFEETYIKLWYDPNRKAPRLSALLRSMK